MTRGFDLSHTDDVRLIKVVSVSFSSVKLRFQLVLISDVLGQGIGRMLNLCKYLVPQQTFAISFIHFYQYVVIGFQFNQRIIICYFILMPDGPRFGQVGFYALLTCFHHSSLHFELSFTF